MVKADASIKIKEELEISRKNESLLAKLLENSSQPFGVGYPDGRLGLVNKAFEKLTGYSREELKNTDWSDVLTPLKFRNMEKQKLEELLHTGQPVRYEKEYIRKDGTRVPIELLVHIVKSEDGKPEYYYSFITDISERKLQGKYKQELLEKEQQLTEELQSSNEELQSTTEELHQHMNYLTDLNKKLKQSEEKFFKAFQSNPAPMSLSDGYKWLDVNESYSKLTGYSKEELIGHTPAELNFINTKNRDQYIKESKDQGTIADVELEIRTKSGDKRIVLSSTEIIELDNEIRFINFIHDITKRREKELLSDALNEMNGYINSTLDYDEIMQLIVELGAKTLNAESSVVNIREGGNWVVKFVYNFPNNIIGQIKSDQESPTSMYVFNKKETVAFNDAKNDPRVNKNGMEMHGVASLLVVPIILKDKVEGIIAFYHHKKRVVFSKEQIDFANKLAASLSQSLENAIQYDEIKKSEEKFSKVFHSNPGAMTLSDEKGYIDVNQSFLNLTKYSRAELIGNTPADLNIIDKKTRLQAVNDLKDKGSNHRIEYEIQTKSGEKRDILANFESIQLNNEIKFISFLYDITNLKKSEEALRQSEDKYRSIVETATEGIWIADINARTTFVNKKTTEMLGYSSKELIGKKVYNFMDEESISLAKNNLKKRLNGKSNQYEQKYIRKDGTTLWTIASATPLRDRNGSITATLGMITDITDRKKVEDALKRHAALLDVSYEAIFSWELDGNILSWNQGAERLYGYNSKEAIGLNSHQLLKPPFYVEFNVIKKILLDNNMWTGELVHRTKEGKYITVESRLQLINDSLGRLIVIETNRDITERKANEEKMKSTMAELMRSNRELEQFAYVSSHDLQEPLRMVTLYSQLLERRYKNRLDDDADDFIEYIVEGALRMKQLIDDLLAYSRVTSHAKKLENVNLEKIIKAAISNLSLTIKENDAKITYNHLPTVVADSSQMLQVFQNLITNAIKFHGHSHPKIHISAQNSKNDWTISVADNGIGINSEHQKQIFDVFKRLHTRDTYPGSGIGLSICQKIIERYGGRIWVESQPGQGSTFYFTISKY